MTKKRVLTKILILEVNQNNFNSLEKLLKNGGYDSINYHNVEDIKSELEGIGVVLVNTSIDYLDIIQIDKLINSEQPVRIPIVFLDNSKTHDKELIYKCYKHGASDFIKRPFCSKEILARIDYHFDSICKIREYKLRVDKLAHLATVDQMSKLTSKMHMQAILKHQINNFNRYKNPTSILYIGLVSVEKMVNTFGFEYGEKLIHSFSKKLKSSIRESDAISRWYGSNFMILLSGTNVKQAEVVARKLNSSLSSMEIMKDTKPILAFGITEFLEDDSMEEIEQRAVYALKEAKKQEYGRISIC